MAEAGETVRDALNAAFDAVEKAAPPAPRPPPAERRAERAEPREAPVRRAENARETPEEAPEPAETEEPEAPEPTERRADRPRDQFGRFLSATPEAPSQSRREAAPEPEDDTPSLPDQPEHEAPEQAPGPAILPPQAWSAAAKDQWHQLPRPIQEEVDRREREVSRAFQQRAEQTNVYEPLAKAIAPYSQKLALKGVNPANAVEQLLAVQDLLDRDPIQGVAHVARVYGVDLRQFATAYQQAQQPQDPVIRDLAQRVAQQDRLIQSWQQGAQAQEQQRINAEVQAFSADTRNYPYFEHVRPRMAELMGSGAASTLAQAYKLACADNEQISAAIAEAQRTAERAARQTAEKQAVDRARRAAVSVSGPPYGGNAGGGGSSKIRSIREEVAAAYDEQVGPR